MNFEHFIAQRIYRKNKTNFSKPIVRLGVVSVSLGLTIMVIAVAILTGFQNQIRDKIIGFGSHILISSFDVNSSHEQNPLSKNLPFYASIDTVDGVNHIQVFATKAGIIKTSDQIEGVILKGIGNDYKWSFFKDKIIDGDYFITNDTIQNNKVIISKKIASKLRLKVGDPLRMYFIISDELQPRGRKFEICGIYETGLNEFDDLYVIGDISHIQKLNKWDGDMIGGFEVLIDDFRQLDEMDVLMNDIVGYKYKSQTIKQLHPQIFDWLSLQDMNVIIIIALMIMVAGITMISTLLILILEKTAMIGTLKALGSKNKSIRKIFIYNAVYIIGQGLIWGNIIALGLCYIQIKTGLLKLDQESYYVSEIPVNLQLSHFVIINFGTLLLCTLMLIIPTYIVTRISPVKAIKYN